MRGIKKVILGGLLGAIMFVLTGCGTTVNLDKYVTIESSGYDSMGTATSTFDYDAFEEDFSGKIKLSKNAKNSEYAMELFGEEDAAELLIELCVSRKLDKTSNLSNGDVVTLKWNCDEETAKNMFNVTFKYSDIEHKVSQLQEVGKFNPFDYVDVSFEGISPKGKVMVTVDYNQPEMQYISFVTDEPDKAKTGDVVTLGATITGGVDAFVEKFGCVLAETTREYVVEGLGHYVTDVAEIPAEQYELMRKHGEDECRAYVAKMWSYPEKLQSVNLVGTYLLRAKEGMSVDTQNQLYYLYEIVGLNPDPEEMVSSYFYVAFDDIVLNADETCKIDLAGARKIHYSYWGSDASFKVGKYTYTGYESPESFVNTYLAKKIDKYEYTATILQ